ncbi:MAG: PspC domain-containing protein [Renibacterium salmoninarum]|nr:PspC domain-containing protein [Renibacterium salmoninarum]
MSEQQPGHYGPPSRNYRPADSGPGQPTEPLGGTPPGDPRPGVPSGGQAREQADRFFDWIRGLQITRGQDRWFGGVASGLAHRLGVDPIIVRGLLVVLTLFFGLGIFAYGVAWALLPEPDGRIHAQEVSYGRWSPGMTGAVIFTVLGMTPLWRGALSVVFGARDWWFPWPLLWVAGVVGVIVWAVNSGRKNRSGQTGSPTQAPAAAGGAAPMTAPAQPYRPADPGAAGYAPPTQPYQTFQPVPQHTAPVFRPERMVPRVPGPGAATIGITSGAAILLAGAIFLADVAGWFPDSNGSVATLAWGTAAVVCALGIVVCAVRGRSSGVLGFFAVLAIAVSAAFAVLPSSGSWVFARSATWSPTSAEQAEQGYSMAAATGSLDLADLGNPGGDVSIPVYVNAGSAKISVPSDLRVVINEQMWIRSLYVNGQKLNNSVQNTVVNPAATGGTVTLQVRGTVGDVSVTTTNPR